MLVVMTNHIVYALLEVNKMNFGTKLQGLRKSKGLSQEALAEKLSVSRQAVSKWETGEGYPEMEKLIIISDLFDVSLDYLMKDMSESTTYHQEKFYLNQQKIIEYMNFKKSFAFKIAIAIAIIILSVIFPIVLKNPIGPFMMLVIVACAVSILILTGLSSSQYKELEKSEINMSFDDLQNLQSQYTKFRLRFGMIIAFGVCLIIISVASIILIHEYLGEENVIAPMQLMVCVAIAVFLFIVIGVEDSMYRFLICNHEYLNRKKKEESSKFSITMPLASMVYLIMGFTKGWWHPGWIVFPVTAIITLGIEKFIGEE